MKWALFARLGERFSRLRARRNPAPREIAAEFSTEELAEFLEGDLHPNDARPEFREQLREDLWAMMQELNKGGAPPSKR
ncbi:MAG TPA: hypothetical protein VII78_15235 [Myxococcota bacterium]|jgi:hypothetical protein